MIGTLNEANEFAFLRSKRISNKKHKVPLKKKNDEETNQTSIPRNQIIYPPVVSPVLFSNILVILLTITKTSFRKKITEKPRTIQPVQSRSTTCFNDRSVNTVGLSVSAITNLALCD